MMTPSRLLRLLSGLFLLWATGPVSLADVNLVLAAPIGALTAKALRVWVVALNDGAEPVQFEFAPEIHVELDGRGWSAPTSLKLEDGASRRVTLAPGTFERRAYHGRCSERTYGPVEVAFGASRIVLSPAVEPAPTAANAPASTSAGTNDVTSMSSQAEVAPTVNEEASLLRYFKAHFEPYEPMYFIAGFDQPNAKFQLSVRYRIFNEDGWVPNHLPPLANFYAAYTQTSLWDWEADSAPFKDSSYRPELHYSWRDIFKARAHGGPYQWDLETGLQHESNGRGALDSRSLNIAYLRPRLTVGRPGDFQVAIMPRAWVYLGEVEGRHTATGLPMGDPVELYRGYVDLRLSAGWRDSLMISAYGRLGSEANRGSVTVDASYPLKSLPFGTFAGYLYVQYFNGYGESLLDYDLRSETVRFGFSMWR